MHEISIVLGMIDELMRIANENNARKVLSVNLKIGKMSGIVTDSLMFAFDAVKLEHPILSSAAIKIKEIPLVYKCGNCKKSFSPRQTCLPAGRSAGADRPDDICFPSCPDCESYKLQIVSGEEMDIENLEVEV